MVSAILALYLLGIGWIPNFAESYSTGNLDVITAVLPVSKPARKWSLMWQHVKLTKLKNEPQNKMMKAQPVLGEALHLFVAGLKDQKALGSQGVGSKR